MVLSQIFFSFFTKIPRITYTKFRYLPENGIFTEVSPNTTVATLALPNLTAHFRTTRLAVKLLFRALYTLFLHQVHSEFCTQLYIFACGACVHAPICTVCNISCMTVYSIPACCMTSTVCYTIPWMHNSFMDGVVAKLSARQAGGGGGVVSLWRRQRGSFIVGHNSASSAN